MTTNNLKNDVKKLADFAIKAEKIGPVWSFKSLEDELEIKKQDVISIFDMFRKAQVFDYNFLPWDPGDEDYDIAPTREMIENRTGGFFIGNLEAAINKKPHYKTDIKKLTELIESPKKLDLFLNLFHSMRGLPELKKDRIIWGDVTIPVERGHRIMMGIFLEDPKIFNSNGKIIWQ